MEGKQCLPCGSRTGGQGWRGQSSRSSRRSRSMGEQEAGLSWGLGYQDYGEQDFTWQAACVSLEEVGGRSLRVVAVKVISLRWSLLSSPRCSPTRRRRERWRRWWWRRRGSSPAPTRAADARAGGARRSQCTSMFLTGL